MLLILLVNLKSFGQCVCSPVSVFPSTVNGVSVSETFTGDVQSYGSVGTYCGIDAGPSWIGQSSSFSQTFTFSTAVNNLQIAINASNTGEDFTFTVNNGSLTCSQACGSCPYIQTGNVFSTPSGVLGAGIITLTSTLPYTSVTISGPGGGATNGSLMGLCSVSMNSTPCSSTPIVANFSSTSVCLNTIPIQFTNSSTNDTCWTWDFGDSNTSTLQNPSHTYNTCGTFNAKLIVSNGTGCKDSITKTITVNCLPIANFSFTTACLSQPTDFTDLSTVSGGTISNWSWDFGDGAPLNTFQGPSHTYQNPGSYTVTLIVTTNTGCKDTISKNVVVHLLPNAQYSTANVCEGVSVQFTDSSSIAASDTIKFWTWNFADSSPLNNNQNTSHLYAAPGSYVVQLLVVSNFGCVDSITKTVIVHPKPISNFTFTSVCHSSSTQFTDSSTTALGTITTSQWIFGDTSPLNNTQSPAHLYANAGIYNVNLIVNNSFGCADTITKPVEVYYNPSSDFTFSNVCFGDTMHFVNTSSVNNSTSIAGTLWTFGDGGATSSLQNPSHYYSVAGTYTVTLVTTTIDSCSNTDSISVKAFDAPGSAFTITNACLFDSTSFTNTTLNPVMGTTASWSWDFGDGSPLNTTGWSPNHLYATLGSYQVTLITHSSNLGCPDTLKDSVIVFPKPVADYSFANVCLNQAMNFNDLSTISSGSIASWSWNFGDSTLPDSNQNPNHVYANPGTYSVSLIVTTNNGCKDTVIKSVVVHPFPDAQFSSSNVCDGSIVPFNDLSTIPATDTIQSWSWNFGDGSPVFNNQDTSHLYAASGSYSVHLLVVSNFGCSDSTTKTIVINPNPVVNFSATDTAGCELLCLSFQDLSDTAVSTNVQWTWDIGDGSSPSSSQNFDHCYTNDSVFAPNFFNVTLTVKSDSGCVGILTKNNYITVYPHPNASFTVLPQTTIITEPDISISNLSVGGNFGNWNFGDLDTSSSFNPHSHTYADTGIYTITLITSTLYGCVDTAYETIVIEPDFVFYIPNGFTPNDDGLNDKFSGKGINIKNYEMMIFDRWGNLIFYTDDITKGWDGRANHGSEIAQQDVYVYSIKLTDFKRVKHSYKGIVSLVR